MYKLLTQKKIPVPTDSHPPIETLIVIGEGASSNVLNRRAAIHYISCHLCVKITTYIIHTDGSEILFSDAKVQR